MTTKPRIWEPLKIKLLMNEHDLGEVSQRAFDLVNDYKFAAGREDALTDLEENKNIATAPQFRDLFEAAHVEEMRLAVECALHWIDRKASRADHHFIETSMAQITTHGTFDEIIKLPTHLIKAMGRGLGISVPDEQEAA